MVESKMNLRRAGDKRLRVRKRLGGISGFDAFVWESGKYVPCVLQDLSSQGLALVLSRGHFASPPRHGDYVDVLLENRRGSVPPIELRARVVNIRELTHGRLRVGLALVERRSDLRMEDHRNGPRFRAHKLFLAHAYCEKPFDYWDFSHFVVEDVSATGMALLSPERTDVFVPGIELHFVVSLPIVGLTQVRGQVRGVEQGPDLALRISVEFIEPSIEFLQNLAEYLLITGVCADVGVLRKHNFPVKKLSIAYRVRYASSVYDHEEVQSLACHNLLASPLGAVWQPDADDVCLRTRQLICMVGRRTVATWTINFVTDGIEQAVLEGKVIHYSEEFSKRRFIEIPSYSCVRGYRNIDVLLASLRHTVRVAYDTGYDYVVIPLDPHITRAVERYGLELLGARRLGLGKFDLVVINVSDALARVNGRLRDAPFSILKTLAENNGILQKKIS